MDNLTLRELLFKEFNKRKLKNPRYSNRAFARHLAVSSTAMHEFLSGKRELSRANLEKIALKIPEATGFLETHDTQKPEKAAAPGNSPFLHLSREEFEEIHCRPCLEMYGIAARGSHSASPSALATSLQITEESATRTLRKLLDFGVVREEEGLLKRTEVILKVNHPIECRERHTLMTPLSPESLNKCVRKFIQTLQAEERRQAQAQGHSEETPKEVHAFVLDFFPVSPAGEV